jgi:hypothetical protein
MSKLKKYPFPTIYYPGWRNVTKQGLELDVNQLPNSADVRGIISGGVFLTNDEVIKRGPNTQAEMDWGHIAHSKSIPLIPYGYFFLQSDKDDSGDSQWYSLLPYESDPGLLPINSQGEIYDEVEKEGDYRSLSSRWGLGFKIKAVAPPNSSTWIDYSLYLNYNDPLVFEMQDEENSMLAFFDFKKEVPTYQKIASNSDYLPLPTILSIPNTSQILIQGPNSNAGSNIFITSSGIHFYVRMGINTSGSLFYESVAIE